MTDGIALNSPEDALELARQIAEHCALLDRMEAAAALPVGPARAAAIAVVTAAMEAHSGPLFFPAPLP